MACFTVALRQKRLCFCSAKLIVGGGWWRYQVKPETLHHQETENGISDDLWTIKMRKDKLRHLCQQAGVPERKHEEAEHMDAV